MTIQDNLRECVAALEALDQAVTPGTWTMDQPRMGFSAFRADKDHPVLFTCAAGCTNPRENHQLILILRNTLTAQLGVMRELSSINYEGAYYLRSLISTAFAWCAAVREQLGMEAA